MTWTDTHFPYHQLYSKAHQRQKESPQVNKFLKYLSLISILSNPAIAADIKTFDIAGIKLGMNFDEAKQIAITSLGGSESSVRLDPIPRPNPISGK